MSATIIINRSAEGGFEITTHGIPYAIKEDASGFYAYSPVFKTLGYSANSIEEATQDLDNANKEFFEVHLQRGSLPRALARFGWENRSLMPLDADTRFEAFEDDKPFYSRSPEGRIAIPA